MLKVPMPGPSILRSSSVAHALKTTRPLPSNNRLRYTSTQPHPPDSPKHVESSSTPHSGGCSQRPLHQPVIVGTDVNRHLANVKERLQGWSERTALLLRQRVDKHTADIASTFSQLGSELNRVTGYEEIEVLKRRVVEQGKGLLAHYEDLSVKCVLVEAKIDAVRLAAREAKEAYDKAVRQRASSQREVNDLLQRKSHWNDEDVSRFTSLVRQDHVHEQEEARAKTAAMQSEDAVEREFSELMRVILNRYHEEQAWSDKIRSASTYGSLAALAVNTVVFVLAIIVVEPWKRRKLAQTFGRQVEQMNAENTALFESQMEELNKRLEVQDRMLSQVLETVYYLQVPETNAPVSSQAANDNNLPPGVDQESTPASLEMNRVLAFAIATSATAAGILGWLARSWYG
ncbi:hypothetical protein AcW1_007696 [Taiwanofungus camphoratus]|nr:hypothetical protein AcV7_009898 [Antrodia cinnamomea]KAI0953494.1 hypothetical protein AcW1_007696 [Antrodia cinnamomea]